jgi:hypothetical protein
MAVDALTLHEEITRWNPDLILIASDDAARDVLEQVCVTTQFGARPIVVFTEDDDAEAMRMAIRARVTRRSCWHCARPSAAISVPNRAMRSSRARKRCCDDVD